MLVLPLSLTPPNLFSQQRLPPDDQYQTPEYAPPDPNNGRYAQIPQQAFTQQSNQNPNQYANPDLDSVEPQPPAPPFTSEQIEEMVAPIALYPDTLVAQILAASTYPVQVAGADNWLRMQRGASSEQIAAGADSQSNWDPSIKALTAFPSVLALMDHDLQWTTDLGNAYYSQPQDVLQVIQVMRRRAQAAGTLQNTEQEAVTYDQGNIQLAPVNPQIVYVPTYNPWDVYGRPVSPYPGFSLLGALQSFAGSAPVRFGLGIGMSAFSHTGFGWMSWALNWLTQSVLFHQSNYVSHSTTVARCTSPRSGSKYGSQWDGRTRQPNGYFAKQDSYNRPANGHDDQRSFSRPYRPSEEYANRLEEPRDRGYAGTYSRTAPQTYAYNRPQAPLTIPARPQIYARAGGYGFNGYPGQNWATRPALPSAIQQQNWHAPQATPQRGESLQQSYWGNRAYEAPAGRSFAKSYRTPQRSGGFHLFGGGRGEGRSDAYRAPKVSKGYGGGKSRERSGGHRDGGHHR